MSTDTLPTAPENVAQTVAWLEEERRKARADVARLQAAFDTVDALTRDLINRAESLESDTRAHTAALGRLPRIDDQLRHAIEPIASLTDRVTEVERQVKRFEQMRDIQTERDRRSFAETEAILTEFQRGLAEAQAGVCMVVDDVRRVAKTVPVAQEIAESSVRRVDAVIGRLTLLEQWRQQDASELATLRERLTQIGDDIGRLDNWQQLNEIRSTRQIGEWQQQMAEFQQAVATVIRATQEATQAIAPIKDAIEQTRQGASDLRARFDAFHVEIATLGIKANQQQQSLEDLAARVDADKLMLSRLGEHDGTLDLAVEAVNGQARDLARKIADVGAATATATAWIGRVESTIRTAEAKIGEVQLEWNRAARDLVSRLDAAEVTREAADRRLDARIAEVEAREEAMKRRQIAELELQIREARRDGPSEVDDAVDPSGVDQ